MGKPIAQAIQLAPLTSQSDYIPFKQFQKIAGHQAVLTQTHLTLQAKAK